MKCRIDKNNQLVLLLPTNSILPVNDNGIYTAVTFSVEDTEVIEECLKLRKK